MSKGASGATKVLFVCAQNVLRSQAAAALFNKYRTRDDVSADSAGVRVEKPGETITERMEYSDGAKNVVACLAEEGIDITKNTRKSVEQSELDTYDRIVVMAEPELVPDWLSAHEKYEYWYIEDPRYKGLEETKKTQELIKSRVLSLIAERGY